MRCFKCDRIMEEKKTTFTYLGHEVTYPVLRCPGCGQAFISEELVNGKIHEVEVLLEEK